MNTDIKEYGVPLASYKEYEADSIELVYNLFKDIFKSK